MTPDAIARTGRSARNKIVVDPRSWSDARVGEEAAYHWLIASGAGILATTIVLLQSRFLTFYGDEWNFLFDRPALLAPNNEHWSTGLYLVYYGILGTIGGQSYLPFMVVLVLAHLAAAAGLFTLVRGRAGDMTAAIAGAALLLLGAASEDLFWAWQTGFVGAAAFGIWGLVALERKQPARAAVLLTAGLAMSGVGLFFLAAASAYVLRSRRGWAWLALPVGAYLAWYLAFGAADTRGLGEPFSSAALAAAPAFVARGVMATFAGLTGFAWLGIPLLALPLLVALGVAVPWRDPLVAAAAAGILAEYSLIAIARIGTFDADLSQLSRYQYPAAMLILVAIALASQRMVRLRPLLAALAIIAIAVNTVQLTAGPQWPRYQVAEAYGCLPATVPAFTWAQGREGRFAVPAEVRC